MELSFLAHRQVRHCLPGTSELRFG